MINFCRSREKMNGWLGRRRTYTCRECSVVFKVDTLHPLPKNDRVCPDCNKHTTIYLFINKHTGKEMPIRATSAELATLKAWKVNRNLTFKAPQPEGIGSC